MYHIDADGEGSGPGTRARIRVWCSVSGTERIVLCLQLGSRSDVRESLRLRFSVKKRHG